MIENLDQKGMNIEFKKLQQKRTRGNSGMPSRVKIFFLWENRSKGNDSLNETSDKMKL